MSHHRVQNGSPHHRREDWSGRLSKMRSVSGFRNKDETTNINFSTRSRPELHNFCGGSGRLKILEATNQQRPVKGRQTSLIRNTLLLRNKGINRQGLHRNPDGRSKGPQYGSEDSEQSPWRQLDWTGPPVLMGNASPERSNERRSLYQRKQQHA